MARRKFHSPNADSPHQMASMISVPLRRLRFPSDPIPHGHFDFSTNLITMSLFVTEKLVYVMQDAMLTRHQFHMRNSHAI